MLPDGICSKVLTFELEIFELETRNPNFKISVSTVNTFNFPFNPLLFWISGWVWTNESSRIDSALKYQSFTDSGWLFGFSNYNTLIGCSLVTLPFINVRLN